MRINVGTETTAGGSSESKCTVKRGPRTEPDTKIEEMVEEKNIHLS